MRAFRTSKPQHLRRQVVAEFHHHQQFEPISGRLEAPEGVTVTSALRAPAIIREPRWVKFGDRYFHLRREGLYRLWDWGRVLLGEDGQAPEWLLDEMRYTNVILFRDDILALLGALATLQHHGHRHIGLPLKEQLAQLKRGSLSLTCGPSSELVRVLLDRYGWRTRPVNCIRCQGEWNGWNDGHVLNEMYWPKHCKWVLVDVNAHRLFVKGGALLNAGEVCDLVRSGGSFDFHWLTPRGLPLVDITPEILGAFPKSSYGLANWHDDDAVRQSLGEMLRMPLLHRDGALWFHADDPALVERICRYRPEARAVPREEWMAMFYGPESVPG